MKARSEKKTVLAPELDGGSAWLNVDQPLTIAGLRGSVVLLDFWTYCCINCMHVLPTLQVIEERHRDDPLVVIGVHSGKFSAEQDPAQVREAVGRYGVRHPVVVDDDMTIWSRYGIRSWPTMVVIRPDGTIAAVAPGEPDLETLDAFLCRELELAAKAGTLATELPHIAATAPPTHRPLSYPGKALVLPDGRLVVSDSGHHRLLVCDRQGAVLLAVGSGLRGFADGVAGAAAFDHPQGACFWGGALYVADTRNHAIRRIDLGSGEVSTVAGTGKLGCTAPAERRPALAVALRSPWDLCAVGDAIYVAMAGSHQIWRLWPADGQIELYAGSGVEALLDGPVAQSAWAQPSGLSERQGTLYVADSETSAVRAVDLQTGTVQTLVGQGLFDFGDDDGEPDAALLQHCLDVAAADGAVLIADTYNDKIKRLSLTEPVITTIIGGLSEPGSICQDPDGSWVIADTNAHRVVRLSAGQLQAIDIRDAPPAQVGDLSPPLPAAGPTPAVEGWFTSLLQLDEGVGLSPGAGRVTLSLASPAGRAFVDGSPLRVTLEVSRRSDLLLLEQAQLSLSAGGGTSQRVAIDVRVTELPEAQIEAELVAQVDYVACDTRARIVCTPLGLHVRVPVRLLREGGSHRLDIEVPLPSPDA